MSVDQAARLRAFELARTSPRMTLLEAFQAVYSERYGDDVKAILRELAKQAAGSSGALARSTYNIAETDNGDTADDDEDDDKLVLFDIPAVIAVPTPDAGPLFIQADIASGDEVKQWLQAGHRHHSTQRYRFKNGLKDLELLDDSELKLNFRNELRPMLADRKRAMIEDGS